MDIPTTEFLIKAFRPTVAETVSIAIFRNCRTARDLCDYLLLSPRARNNLLSAIASNREFEQRKVRIYHPLFPSYIVVYPNSNDDRFRARIRRYFRSLPLEE